jgi:TPR repeat protein
MGSEGTATQTQMKTIVGNSPAVCRWHGNVVGLILLFVTSAFCFAGDVDELVLHAQKAYSAKRYEEALKTYREAASMGSPIALFQLGAMHERGEGVERDTLEAVKWYERAIDAGSVSAAKRLANMYYDGQGVSKSLARAASLYERAGELGDAGSYFTLGQIYWIGASGSRDPKKAVEVFTKAAEAGNPLAMNALGIAYRLGDGVDKSDAAAYAYFQLASEFGNAIAAGNLEKLATLISDSDRSAGEKLLKHLRQKITIESKKAN